MPTPLSPVSLDGMVAAVEKVRRRLRRAVAALEGAHVLYAVAGGNAVAAWVARVDETAVRNTADIDVLLRRADLPAARLALESAGFTYRRISGLDIFLDGERGSLRDAIHVLPAGERLGVDDALPSPDVTAAEPGGDFTVVALEALVRMKLVAYRDKDRVHLRDLLAVGLVDASWIASLPPPLDGRLRALVDTPQG